MGIVGGILIDILNTFFTIPGDTRCLIAQLKDTCMILLSLCGGIDRTS